MQRAGDKNILHLNYLAALNASSSILYNNPQNKFSYMKANMAELINLNKRRKVKKRLEKEKKAVENRIKFGRTKKEKQIEKQKKERDKRHIDGHKLEKNEGE